MFKELVTAAALGFAVEACSGGPPQVSQGELNSHPVPPTEHELTAKRYVDAILAEDASLAGSFLVQGQEDNSNLIISNLKGCQLSQIKGINEPGLPPNRKQVNLTFKEPCGLEDVNGKIIGMVIVFLEAPNGEYAIEIVGSARKR